MRTWLSAAFAAAGLTFSAAANAEDYPSLNLKLAHFVQSSITGSKIDKKSIERIKPALVFDRPHLKRSAWVGVENLPKVFYEHLKSFSQRELPTFKTREEALDWLVQD